MVASWAQGTASLTELFCNTGGAAIILTILFYQLSVIKMIELCLPSGDVAESMVAEGLCCLQLSLLSSLMPPW